MYIASSISRTENVILARWTTPAGSLSPRLTFSKRLHPQRRAGNLFSGPSGTDLLDLWFFVARPVGEGAALVDRRLAAMRRYSIRNGMKHERIKEFSNPVSKRLFVNLPVQLNK